MKKFTIVLFLSMCLFSVEAQSNCQFSINVVTEIGTCYNNCLIRINLTDSIGQLLDINSTDLEDVKYYVIEEHSSDTSLSFSNEFLVRASTYKAGVQAVCKYVRGVGDTIYTRIDTATTVTTTTTYVTPSVSFLTNIPKNETAFGTVPTFTCENTGRVQLLIRNGAFPYQVVICDAGLNPIDTVVFTERMYTGNDEQRYDYKDYYSIDGLGAGQYSFLVSDGCGYVMPVVNGRITTVDYPYVEKVCWYNYTGNSADSNVIRIYLEIYADPGFYSTRIPQNIEYRFIYPEIDGVVDTTEWKHPGGPYRYRDRYTYSQHIQTVSCDVYDTVWRARSYCDLRGTITVETRTVGCNGYTHQMTHSFQNRIESLGPWKESVYGTDSTIAIDSYHDCLIEKEAETASYVSMQSVRAGISNSMTHIVAPSNSCTSGSTFRRKYYTGALNWICTTADGDTVKTGTHYDKRISTREYYPLTVTREEALAFLDTAENMTPYLYFQLVDSKNCPVARDSICFDFNQRITTTGGEMSVRGAMKFSPVRSGMRYSCYNSNSAMTIDPIITVPMQYNDGYMLELIESPYDNFYNFTAQYSHAARSWTIAKEHPECLSEIITNLSNRTIILKDYGLPSGFYVFRSSFPGCTESVVDTFRYLNDYGIRIIPSEMPSYELTNQCSELILRPLSGEFIIREPVLFNGTENVHRDSVDYISRYGALYKIVSGPPGGYPSGRFFAHNIVTLTRPGTYVVRMYADECPSGDSYHVDDTIYFSGGTVEHEYDIAYTCNAASTEGFVRVKSINGTAPYTYNLYSGPDKTGTLLASNQTGRFDNVPVRSGQVVSVESIDQCFASFYVNVNVHDLENLHKCWLGGGVYASEECEGTLVHLNSLNFGDDVIYRWEGPDGFASAARDTSLFLQRGASGGTYKVQFSGTGCGIVEDSVSIQVKPAPSVHIADDAIICPGDTVSLTYTSSGVGDVHYTIGHQQPSGTTFQNYTNSSGHSYVPYSEGIFWVHSVQDDNCTYTIPEDTVHITLRTRYASSCMVSALHDTVCQGDDATVHARSSLTPPYTLHWYRDNNHQQLLRSDIISSATDYADFHFFGLTEDTAVYVTAENSEYCESHPQTIFSQMNMAAGNTSIECGKSILFRDSGGNEGEYRNNESVKHTFFSTDNTPITLIFSSFSVESPDKLLVYSGDTTHPDSLIAELTGNLNTRLPAPIVSNGSSMTLWFLSNLYSTSAGWDAQIGSNFEAVTAIAKVLDSVKVAIDPLTPAPFRYNGDVTLQAAASGGRGVLYQYTWETSTDETNWIPALTEATDTSELRLIPLTESLYVRVAVADCSPDACNEKDTAYYYIPVSDIRLSLTLEMDPPQHCSEIYTGKLTVRNAGTGAASEVSVRLRLPQNCAFNDTYRGIYNISNIAPGDSVTFPFNMKLSSLPTSYTTYIPKAQIWSCLYGDAATDVVYGDWDWNGNPRQADEDTAQFFSFPYSYAQPAVVPDTVCYMQTATLSANPVAGISFPQYFNWYNDDTHNHLIQSDTLHTAAEMARLSLPNVSNTFTYYVKVDNDSNCLPETTPVKVVYTMPYLPLVTAFNDTVCFGSTATLSASSELDFPQYYEWWNASLDSVLLCDTVSSGNISLLNFASLTTDTTLYVSVSNRTTCPYRKEAFRKNVTGDFLLNDSKNDQTTIVAYMDSIPFYDDGGPDGVYTAYKTYHHTFVAEEGAQVVLTMDYLNVYTGIGTFAVYDGDSWRARSLGYFSQGFTAPRTFTSTSGKLHVYFNSGTYYRRDGWSGSITTDVEANLTPAKASVYVQPALDTTLFVYSTCPDTVLLSYEGFNNIDISVPGEYVIDSVFTAANGCDSVVRLLLTVTDPSSGLSCPDTVVRGLADGETHVLITGSELGIPTTSFTPDTLFNNVPSDGRYPLGDHTVTWSAVNECGDTVTCTQCVRVLPPCNDAVDFEGNVYPAIRIGCQCWTQTNIRSAFYSDGTPVASYSSYNGSDSLRDLYGNLYSWYSAVRVPENDDLAVPLLSTDGARTFVQGICPEGWGVPTIEDFEILYFNAGERLAMVKEADTRFWVPGTEGATPNSGFNARGGGLYNAALGRYEGLMTSAAFWAVDITRNPAATSVVMPAFCDMETDPQPKSYGLSIRCVKNYCGE